MTTDVIERAIPVTTVEENPPETLAEALELWIGYQMTDDLLNTQRMGEHVQSLLARETNRRQDQDRTQAFLLGLLEVIMKNFGTELGQRAGSVRRAILAGCTTSGGQTSRQLASSMAMAYKNRPKRGRRRVTADG